MNKTLKRYLAKIGAKGGRVKSARKTAACRANALLARKRPVELKRCAAYIEGKQQHAEHTLRDLTA